MINAFAANPNLRRASRLPTLSETSQVSLAEIACLLVCGGLAVFAIGFIHVPLRIPGHAILRGVLPVAMGLSLVPRRSAGSVTAIGAAFTSAALSSFGVGRFPPAAMLSAIALGPILDFALAGATRGWQLYARFALGGAAANLLAFAARYGLAIAGWDFADSRQFVSFWSIALVSFTLCGAAAGLLSAVVWFRLRVKE